VSSGGREPTLVVSGDAVLAGQLTTILEKDHSSQVETRSSYTDASEFVEQHGADAVFLDLRSAKPYESPAPLLHCLSQYDIGRTPVIAITETGYACDWAAAADLLISGHISLPIDRRQLADLLERGVPHQLFNSPPTLPNPRIAAGKDVTIKTFTPAVSGLIDNMLTVAAHDVTILLVGETGTGKTTMARLIHELSPRKKGRLLTVACGALPPELIESELFGHVRGAFTSADQSKTGKFEAARDGTLLLDEIDILRPDQQAKLLRIIETGEFEPVGSNDTRVSSARLIVASNVDLQKLMEGNEFRADLYYRLNMLEFRIPPLRERPGDIVPMALDFVDDFCAVHDVEIRRVHPDFLQCLKNYHWPGNVRELKNHIRRAVIFCQEGVLTPNNLAPHFRETLQAESAPPNEAPMPGDRSMNLVDRLAMSEHQLLVEALREHDNNRSAAARTLGLSRVGLYKKLKKHGITANE
jgi:DNA-binding NtrC family response regulator